MTLFRHDPLKTPVQFREKDEVVLRGDEHAVRVLRLMGLIPWIAGIALVALALGGIAWALWRSP